MVHPSEDVLDAQNEIRASHFEPTRRGFYDEGRNGRSETSDLRGAIETFQPHEDVCEGGSETVDTDRSTAQPSLAIDTPLFGVSTTRERAPRLDKIGTGQGQCNVKAQAHAVAHCRNFPEHFVGSGA